MTTIISNWFLQATPSMLIIAVCLLVGLSILGLFALYHAGTMAQDEERHRFAAMDGLIEEYVPPPKMGANMRPHEDDRFSLQRGTQGTLNNSPQWAILTDRSGRTLARWEGPDAKSDVPEKLLTLLNTTVEALIPTYPAAMGNRDHMILASPMLSERDKSQICTAWNEICASGLWMVALIDRNVSLTNTPEFDQVHRLRHATRDLFGILMGILDMTMAKTLPKLPLRSEFMLTPDPDDPFSFNKTDFPAYAYALEQYQMRLLAALSREALSTANPSTPPDV